MLWDSIMTEFTKFEISAVSDDDEIAASGTQGSIVLKIAGELDIATSPRLEQELDKLLAAGEMNVVVDLEAVGFMDASGVGALLSGADRAREAGGAIQLLRPSPRVLRVLDILQLNGALPVLGPGGTSD